MRHTTQLSSGFVIHALLALLLVFFWRPAPPLAPQQPPPARALVWTAGFGGGGGGGDGLKAAPAAQKAKPIRADAQFRIPSTPLATALLELPGAVAVLSASDARGAGTDDGKGKGPGSDGPGAGPVKGPGSGPGDGPMPPGTPGLVDPDLIFDRRPEYTSEAMQAKVQGSVLVEAVVLADGSVGEVRVLRSLDRQFGLDQKAIEAVKRWKFRPATHYGKPVAMPVLIELTFSLR